MCKSVTIIHIEIGFQLQSLKWINTGLKIRQALVQNSSKKEQRKYCDYWEVIPPREEFNNGIQIVVVYCSN